MARQAYKFYVENNKSQRTYVCVYVYKYVCIHTYISAVYLIFF